MRIAKFILLVLFATTLAGGIFAVLKNSEHFSFGKQARGFYMQPAHKSPPPRPKRSLPDQAVTGFRLRISGSPRFEKKVQNAVYLIWKRDPDTFKFIKKHVYLIRRADKTGFSVENGVPTVSLTDKTALKSPTWCAGAITRQAYLSFLHYKNRRERGIRPPPPPGEPSDLEVAHNPMEIEYTDFKTMYAIERRADSVQLRVMKKTGAPRSEIKLIQNRKKGDLSLVYDGR